MRRRTPLTTLWRSPRPAALVLAVVLGAAPLAACSSGEGVSVTSGTAASAAPASGSHLDAAAFAAALKRPGTVLLDVRTPPEFAAGHLQGAVNVDLQSPAFLSQLQQLDPTKPYAVYCHSGSRSAAALAQMTPLGFTQAYDLTGGIGAWSSAGGALAQG